MECRSLDLCTQKVHVVDHDPVIKLVHNICCGPGSVVGIATNYVLEGPGIESQRGRDFPHLSRPVLGPTQPSVQWYRVFSGSKKRPWRDADPSPLLVPWSWKGAAIPLLPVRAVRPVRSLSACTRVHFTFTTFYNIYVNIILDTEQAKILGQVKRKRVD
jgi:hypothetical protein